MHNQLDFSREGWKLPDSLRAQLKFDPFMAGNRHEKSSYGKYEFKDEKQAKLVPAVEFHGLDSLETVKTSTGETARNDELLEDLWPNLSAMVTRLQQLFFGNCRLVNMALIVISELVLRVTAHRSCIVCT